MTAVSVQDHFPDLFRPKKDRRALKLNEIVRICPNSTSDFRGLWLVIKSLDDDFVTGLIYVEGQDPVLARVSRLEVLQATRLLYRLLNKSHA